MYLQKVSNGRHVYVKLIEGYRDGTEVRHRIIKNFGRADRLEQEDPDYFEKLQDFVAREGDRLLEEHRRKCEEQLHEDLERRFAEAPGEAGLVVLRFAPYVYRAVWDDVLGLRRKINALQDSRPWSRASYNALLLFFASRMIVAPGAVQAHFQAQKEYLGAPLRRASLDACYRALDLLGEFRKSVFFSINYRIGRTAGAERSAFVFTEMLSADLEPLADAAGQEFLEALCAAATTPCGVDVALEALPADFAASVAALLETQPGASKSAQPGACLCAAFDQNGLVMDVELCAGEVFGAEGVREASERLSGRLSEGARIVPADLPQGFREASLECVPDELVRRMCGPAGYAPLDPHTPEGAAYRVVEAEASAGADSSTTFVFVRDPQRGAREEALLALWADFVRSRSGKRLDGKRPSWSAIAATNGAGVVMGVDEAAHAEVRRRLGLSVFVRRGPLEAPFDRAAFAARLGLYRRKSAVMALLLRGLSMRQRRRLSGQRLEARTALCTISLLLLQLVGRGLEARGTPMTGAEIMKTLHEAAVLAPALETDLTVIKRCGYSTGRPLSDEEERRLKDILEACGLSLPPTPASRWDLAKCFNTLSLQLPWRRKKLPKV